MQLLMGQIKSHMDVLTQNITVLKTFIKQNYNCNFKRLKNMDLIKHNDGLVTIINTRYQALKNKYKKACQSCIKKMQQQKEYENRFNIHKNRRESQTRVARFRQIITPSIEDDLDIVAQIHDESKLNYNHDYDEDHADDDENNRSCNSFASRRIQKQRLITQSDKTDDYYSYRAQEALSIERKIIQISEMMSRIAETVYGQKQTINQIIDNIQASTDNVELGIGELQKYLASLDQNRWLIIKVFAILIFFALFFAAFVA